MTLEQLAKEYEPDQQAIDTVQQSEILLLVGISGAGKDTIQSRLLETGEYHKIVTHTTRQPRANDGIPEQNGREYHFVSQDEMHDLLMRHQMIEVNQYGKNFYGTSIGEFEKAKQLRKIAIGNIDVNGVAVFHRLAEASVHALFLIPPTYEIWRQRLSSRYHTAEEFEREYPDRRSAAIDELEYALNVPYYHFIINDELERAVRVTGEIAHRTDSFNRHDDEARLAARDLLEAIRNS